MRPLLIAAGIILTASVWGTEPQKIEPYARVMKPHPWYVEQANLWKAAVDTNPTDAAAWFNYYRAARYARVTASQKPDSSETLPDLTGIVAAMGKAVPETFEYAYVRFIHSTERAEQITYLLKSYALSPENPEVWLDLVLYYQIRGDTGKTAEFCRKYYAVKAMSPGLYAWNDNLLKPLGKDAVIITYGDNDTYPAWILQQAKHIRPDVTVINAGTLYYDDYRSLILRELGIPPFSKAVADYPDFTAFLNAFVSHLADNSSNHPLYFAGTLPDGYYKSLEGHCYNEGLAIKYSPQPYDNLAAIRTNYEHRYNFDAITADTANDISRDIVRMMNNCYIDGFVLLYKDYMKAGDSTHAKQLRKLMTTIADNGNSERVKRQVDELFDR
jgi:hypothetical protein